MGASEWQPRQEKFLNELSHASSTIAHSFNVSLLQTPKTRDIYTSLGAEGHLKGWQGFTEGLDQAFRRLPT